MSNCYICGEPLTRISFDKYGIRPCTNCETIIRETVEDMHNPRDKSIRDPWGSDYTGEVDLLDEDFILEDELSDDFFDIENEDES